MYRAINRFGKQQPEPRFHLDTYQDLSRVSKPLTKHFHFGNNSIYNLKSFKRISQFGIRYATQKLLCMLLWVPEHSKTNTENQFVAFVVMGWWKISRLCTLLEEMLLGREKYFDLLRLVLTLKVYDSRQRQSFVVWGNISPCDEIGARTFIKRVANVFPPHSKAFTLQQMYPTESFLFLCFVSQISRMPCNNTLGI